MGLTLKLKDFVDRLQIDTSRSFHNRMVEQIAFCTGIMNVQSYVAISSL